MEKERLVERGAPVARHAAGVERVFAGPVGMDAVSRVCRKVSGDWDLPRTAAMFFRAPLASGQITMRKVDGWQSLAEKPSDQAIDLAA